MNHQSSSEVIRHTKSIFARHGILKEIISDNGPQYSSLEYKEFAAEYGSLHKTSSPKYPQSNDEAERALRTVKELLKKSNDPYLAMLVCQSTPLQNGLNPAELLMNCRLSTNLPMIEELLKPQIPDFTTVKAKEEEQRRKQMKVFDSRHSAQELDPLLSGEQVWVEDHNTSGNVVEPVAPRSHHVLVPTGIIRRNRTHLRCIPN